VVVGLRSAAGGTVGGTEETSVRALAKLEQVLPARLRHRALPDRRLRRCVDDTANGFHQQHQRSARRADCSGWLQRCASLPG
jgi:hypothetical protein